MDDSTDSERQEWQQQGDLVIQNFRYLIIKWDGDGGEALQTLPRNHPMSTELIQSKRALFQRLCTSLLPLLHTKIEHLEQTLDPTELRKAPESQLKLSRDIQSEVDWTMDQIDSAQEEICQGACSLRESNDSDLEELKSCRLYVLKSSIKTNLIPFICDSFHKYVDLIHQLDLSTEAFEGEPDTSAAKQQVDEYTSYVCREINLTTLLPQVSDFDNMTHAWYDPVPRIDRALGDFLELIKEAETGPVACPNYTPNDRSIQVVRRLVPLMKLSRLLFNKLSRPPAEEEYALLFSDLPSSQLNALTEMPNKFLQLLADLCALLKDSSAARVDVTVRRLNVLVKSLESLFNRCTNLVDYLMHQTADTAGFPIQNSLKTWLANWNPTFNLAISNIIQAFGSHNRELCECSNCSQQRY
ncbi:hypothetical protein, variant [Puccinia striiformis f. sp. tritici PST-78]|uniref:Uncharacterized protein n=1 Tax=Puccinia striiformis f. sp. tritici PST-78 TaxID=1165861 RepID=A0A0L0VW04_9BASI|nr:hypothetical protein PSTG_03328 [Puccinia striiformis f. sp. tritici PST-78]KNF03388.1 hypothetical protein, variant [Puccinia striiformis f. sp. tritici PST-78]